MPPTTETQNSTAAVSPSETPAAPADLVNTQTTATTPEGNNTLNLTPTNPDNLTPTPTGTTAPEFSVPASIQAPTTLNANATTPTTTEQSTVAPIAPLSAAEAPGVNTIGVPGNPNLQVQQPAETKPGLGKRLLGFLGIGK